MKSLAQLSSAELSALQPGEEFTAESVLSRHFNVLYPTHAAAGRLNDEIVIQLFTMDMAPLVQRFKVDSVVDGQPTFVTHGSTVTPPTQTVIAHVRGRAHTIAQIGAMMLQQALDLDEQAVRAIAASEIEALKARL